MNVATKWFRVAAIIALAGLVGCRDCGTKCEEGITFYVADLAGSLGRGGSEPLHICFDGTCHDVTITRKDSGGSVFLPFSGVGTSTDHTLTVAGVGALAGHYTGPLDSYTQKPGGDCAKCDLTTVKIGADGTLTPATSAKPVTSVSTTTTG
ncbi:MAG TPA: hypothetical protein VGC84_18915 [Ilumatobacteraceae bacterium]